MRSNSPYPVRNSPYARTRSYSRDSGATSPLPVSTSPFTDAPPFSLPAPSCSPYPCLSRPPSESALDDLIERTQECSSEEESEPLLGSEDSVTAVYARRWYLLLLFSSAALMETMSWAMWGPIAESAKAVFSWEDSQITMCVFLGNLSFGLCCIPFSWLMDHKGLRVSMVLSCFFITAGAGLRCLIRFVPSNYYIWCIYGGQMLNGVAGPVAQGGGALFSNLWFPNNQRATSTAISTFIGYAGSALAFVVGPFLVPSPSDGPAPNNDNNNTLPNGNDTEWTLVQRMSQDSGNSSGGPTDTAVMMDAVLDYLDYQAAAAAGLLVLVLVYFPDRPPRPPSLSAATEREDFGPGLAKLLKNRQFWLISAAFCLSMGVFEVWDVVLDVNLSTIGISQETAGWLGFYCVMAGCLTGLLICRLADFFFRQIRLFLILSYVVSAVFVLWFTLIYIGILPLDIVSIYAAIILSGVFLDGCSPLVYELICEAAYPVGEGVSSCFLQMLFVVVGMAFAAVQNVPNIGTEWMNWCLLGTLCVAIPLLFCVTDIYGRADLDQVEQQVTVVNPPHNPSTQRDHAEKEPLLIPRHTPPPPPHRPSPIPRPQSGGYGTCTPAFSPTYHFLSTRPTSEPFHNVARHSQGDSNSSLHVPNIKFTVKRERHKPSNNRGAAGAASIRRNASYQGLDDGEVESEQSDLFDESGRGDVTSSAPSDSVDRGCMFSWDRSLSGSSVSQADRRSVDSAPGPTARYLLTSGRHSVDLSFLRLS